MSKIDLISGKWSDLVFDGRNKSYGAYVHRQETGKRNIWSMVAIFLLALLTWGGLTLKNYVDEQNAERQRQLEAAELSRLQEMENKKKDEPKVERKEIQPEQIEKVIEKPKASVAFQVPEIKPDDQVTTPPPPTDAILKDDRTTGAFNVESDNKDGEVLGAQDVAQNEPIPAPEPEPVVEQPKEEPPVVVKEEPPVVEDKVFEVVEQQPSFPGGASALMQYLSSNIKYPVVAQENGVQGRVIVGFVVDKDGSITNVNVLRGVDPSLDREAERVVKAMPKWVPGKQNGQNVKVKYNVPVTFKLQ